VPAGPLKTELTDCTETSPNKYQTTLPNFPEEGVVSLKLRVLGTAVRNYVTNTVEEPLLGKKGVNMYLRPS